MLLHPLPPFLFLHLRPAPPSHSLFLSLVLCSRVRSLFLSRLVPPYRNLLLYSYYWIAGESQARSDLRGFGSSTYLSVPSPTSSRSRASLSLTLLGASWRGSALLREKEPLLPDRSISSTGAQGRALSFFLSFSLFLFPSFFFVSSIRKEFLFVGSEALEIPGIDRSPRDSAPIRALFRGFSEALDLPDA